MPSWRRVEDSRPSAATTRRGRTSCSRAAVHVPDLGTLAGRHLDPLDAAECMRARPHGGVEERLAGHGVSDAKSTWDTGHEVCERQSAGLSLCRRISLVVADET